jgi:hypothetical protein
MYSLRKIISKWKLPEEQPKSLSPEVPREMKVIGKLQNLPIEEWTEEEKDAAVDLAHFMVKFRNFAEKELPSQMREASSLLLQHYGWHIRPNMSYYDLIPSIQVGDQEVDSYMMRILASSMKEIQRIAVDRFPQRAGTINLAFKAHSRGEYELSVPAFLILSDGIFRAMSKAEIFGNGQRAKTGKLEFLENLKKDNEVLSLLPFTIEAVINGDIIGLPFSKPDYLKFPNVLHRNPIIHGESIDYGTKTNSFKAISQFEFVIRFVYSAFTKGKVSEL